MKNININLIILFFYIIFSIIFSTIISSRIFYQLINPVCLLFSIFLFKDKSYKRFKNINDNIKKIIIITLFYLILNFLSGLIFGYLKNPYSIKPISLIKNIWQFIIPIISIEYIRSTLLNNNKNKGYLVIITIFLILLEFNFKTFFYAKTKEEMFKYICSYILPLISSGFLYTFLTLKGSYKLVLSYRLIYEIPSFILPIIPNHDWFIVGIKGIIFPFIIYSIFKNSCIHLLRKGNKVKQIISMFFSIILVILILFFIGIFKYKPISIISNSMKGVFKRGDVIVYRKVEKKKLKKLKLYNIIIYDRDGQKIVHRIIKKQKVDNTILYTTKGDANYSNDLKPVREENIKGVYIFKIKYIGYPSVWVKELFSDKKLPLNKRR